MRFLSKIGHRLDFSIVELEIKEAKALYKDTPHEEILSKAMTDEVAIAKMMILHEISRIAWTKEKSPRFALISAQMVQLTCKYGVTTHSPVCFSGFGAALCVLNEFELARTIGKFITALIERTNTIESVPPSIMAVYTYIHPSFHSIHESLDHILVAFEKFRELGSLDGCRIALYTHISFGFEGGKYLPNLIEEFENFTDAIPVIPKFMFAINQAILNLCGESAGNPAVLSGDAYDFNSCFDGTPSDPNNAILGLCR